jgi:hypothetical protein
MILWDVELCSVAETNRCFTASYCFHHQNDKLSLSDASFGLVIHSIGNLYSVSTLITSDSTKYFPLRETNSRSSSLQIRLLHRGAYNQQSDSVLR